MYLDRSVVFALVLCAGCGGASKGPSGGVVGGGGAGGSAGASAATVSVPSDPLAPQSTHAAGFPAGMFGYWCQWVEGSSYTAESYAFNLDVAPTKVLLKAAGNETVLTEYPIDKADGAYVIAREDAEDTQRSIVLGDGMIYMLVEAAGAEAPEIQLICALRSDQGRITALTPAAHRERLQTYAGARFQAWLANGELEEEVEPVVVDEVDEGPTWTAAQAAEIARARTMVSFTFEASAPDRNAHTAVVVVATLADGSKMRIGRGNPIFSTLFGVSAAGGEVGSQVEVWPIDADGTPLKKQLQYKEIFYTFEGGSQSLHCEGATGPTGLDQNWNNHGMKFYHGQPGETGPTITVEITTLSSSSPGVLRYRLSCGDKRKVFTASETTAVMVTTVGGNGGHGIPRANGDGTNGGNGGDGGRVIVIVDPSVKRYDLRHESRGGRGGNESDHKQTNPSTRGRRGQDGSPGELEERREPVTIPASSP